MGGIFAPMALDDYEQAKIWAPLIKNAYHQYMPPWGAHKRHRGELKGERYIDKKEKDLLIAWVDGGLLRVTRPMPQIMPPPLLMEQAPLFPIQAGG
ncbi:MAG: hypothetical protein Ct9H90mP25_5740 [Gammaproteobacteria bacterium]|nr:MAG: hypothetical protein Ct9H90mP25_5740 [Gammaproteobacteria bacterium]